METKTLNQWGLNLDHPENAQMDKSMPDPTCMNIIMAIKSMTCTNALPKTSGHAPNSEGGWCFEMGHWQIPGQCVAVHGLVRWGMRWPVNGTNAFIIQEVPTHWPRAQALSCTSRNLGLSAPTLHWGVIPVGQDTHVCETPQENTDLQTFTDPL